jgi:hypothetical protein
LKTTNPADTTHVVVVGQARATIPAGQNRKAALELNSTGRQLLKKRGRLQTTLTVTQAGQPPIHQIVTFR